MVRRLHRKILFLVTIILVTAFASQAQNRIRNVKDARNSEQLKRAAESNRLRKAATLTGRSISPNHIQVAPINDDCANAILLTEEASCTPTTGDVAEATESMPADACGGVTSTNGYDVWFSFVAVTANPYIRVVGSSSFDPVIFLLDGCGGSILDCGDNTASGGAELITSTGLTPGNTYYIRVYDYGSALPITTTFDICVTGAPAPPANDECGDAIVLTESATCTSTAGDLTGATESMAPDACNGFTSSAGEDVWYSFDAVTANPYISVTASPLMDAVVFLFDGCGGTLLSCSDLFGEGGTETIKASGLTIGQTYYIRVYNYGGTVSTDATFDICVFTAPAAPANDDCANAMALTEDATCNPTAADATGATESMPADICSAATISPVGEDVWFSFLATTANPIITTTGIGDFDPVVFLLDACVGSVLACADNTFNGGTEVIQSSGLTIGNTYYIRVYSWGGTLLSDPTFDICVFEAPLVPPNDSMCGAIDLTLDGTAEAANTIDALSTDADDATAVTLGYTCFTPNNTLWYSYTAATADSFYVMSVADQGFEAWVGVFSSDDAGAPCEGNLTYEDCFGGGFSGGTPDTAYIGILPAAAGTTYLFMMDGVAGSTGPFSISVISPFIQVGVGEVKKSSQPSVYPNPTSGILNVDLGTFSKKSTIRVYDLPGNLLKEEISQNTLRTQLDVSNLSNGIYFVKIENENGQTVRKINLNK